MWPMDWAPAVEAFLEVESHVHGEGRRLLLLLLNHLLLLRQGLLRWGSQNLEVHYFAMKLGRRRLLL